MSINTGTKVSALAKALIAQGTLPIRLQWTSWSKWSFKLKKSCCYLAFHALEISFWDIKNNIYWTKRKVIHDTEKCSRYSLILPHNLQPVQEWRVISTHTKVSLTLVLKAMTKRNSPWMTVLMVVVAVGSEGMLLPEGDPRQLIITIPQQK